MKLLTSTALPLLLISLASVSYGQVETINYSDGGVYVGEVRDGQLNGQGTFAYASGNTYVGEWRDGQRDGQGTFTYANGDAFVGEYRNGQRTGQGTETRANGDVYAGEFMNGQRTGQGTLTLANGTIRNGTWRNGRLMATNSNNANTSANSAPPTNRASTSTANQNSSSGNERIKSLCTSYGFTPNTDAHANCVMNMDMQQRAANNEARRRAAQGLYNLGIQLINGGPNTVRRSSGASDPGEVGFLLREAVSGFNKICYYNGPSGAFAINQEAVSICPASANKP